MPIHRLLHNTALDPEEIRVIGNAFEEALAELGLADRSDPTAIMVASRLMDLAKRGERDPDRLRNLVVGSFRHPR